MIIYKRKPFFETTNDRKVYLYFEGIKRINEEISKEDKKFLYTNTIKQGNFSLCLELSKENTFFETTYLGCTYEDGLYTFYYYGNISNENCEKIEF